MKKRVAYVLLFIVVTIVIFSILGNRASQHTDLSSTLNEQLDAGETSIDLVAISDFHWSQVAIFDPYMADEEIEDAMNITFKGDNGNIDVLDDRCLLVFADEQYALKTVVLPINNYRIEKNKYLVVE